jgi:hypothetical protein
MASDAVSFDYIADDLFDGAIDQKWLHEFLEDPRHHTAIARDGEMIIGHEGKC